MKRSALVLLFLAACGGAPRGQVKVTLPAPVVRAGDLDASKLLAETSSRASSLGAGPASVVASGQLSAGERIGAFVEVPADACLLTYARASASLEDIDVAVFAEEGNPVAVDEAPDSHPTVLLCPPHPARVYAAVHAASGEGLVALSAQLVPADKAGEVGKALRAHGARGELPSTEAWPGLADLVTKHRAALGGTWEEQRRVAVAIDERAPTMVALPVDAGDCVDALVIAGEDASLLDVEATDDAGRVVARSNGVGKDASLVICAESPLAATLALRPHVGAGVAAVVLSRAPLAVGNEVSATTRLAWVPTRATLLDARTRLDADLARRGYGGAASVSNVSGVLGRRVTVPLLEATDGCRRVDVLGGAPVAWVRASAWDDKGGWFGESGGASQAVVFSCGKAKVSVDVDVRGRGGALSVVARKERWQSPSFAAYPLAAARMLDRASESGALDAPLASARALNLDAGRREVWEATIASDTCVRTTVGAEGQGSGLGLEVLDAVSGEVLDRGAGAQSTGVRVCSRGAIRRVRYELRLAAGKVDVVASESSRPSSTVTP